MKRYKVYDGGTAVAEDGSYVKMVEVVEQMPALVKQAMAAYLQTCKNGGMPTMLADQIEEHVAVMADNDHYLKMAIARAPSAPISPSTPTGPDDPADPNFWVRVLGLKPTPPVAGPKKTQMGRTDDASDPCFKWTQLPVGKQ